MEALKRLALCCAVFFFLSAQTPAPSGTPPPIVAIPMKKVRHLEYTFNVSYFTNGEGHSSGMNEDGSGGNGSGVDSAIGSGGRRGSVMADITAITSDGGLVVGVNEMLQSEARPSERFTCIVYGDGRTACPGEIRPLTDVENMLLSFLGRGFLDSANVDSANHWKRTFEGRHVSVVTDYTVSDPGDGKPVNIVERGRITSHVPTVGNTTIDAKIAYDRALSLPDSIHDEAHENFSDGTMQTTMDLQLTKDSFANP